MSTSPHGTEPGQDGSDALDLGEPLPDFDFTGLDERVGETHAMLLDMAAQGMDISEPMAQLLATPTEAQLRAQSDDAQGRWSAVQDFQSAEFRGVDEGARVAVTIDATGTVTRTEFLEAALRWDGGALAFAVAEAFAAAEAELNRSAAGLNNP